MRGCDGFSGRRRSQSRCRSPGTDPQASDRPAHAQICPKTCKMHRGRLIQIFKFICGDILNMRADAANGGPSFNMIYSWKYSACSATNLIDMLGLGCGQSRLLLLTD